MDTTSVIIPLHNVARWFPASLASLRAQTVPNWEAFCIDDGSTDATGEILTEALRQEPRLHVTFQPPRGVSAARNRGLQQATGERVTFMDGDDVVQPWWIAEGQRLLAETSADFIRFDYTFSSTPIATQPSPATCILEGAEEIQRWGWPAFTQSGHCWRLFLKRTFAQGATFPAGVPVKEDCLYAFHLLEQQPTKVCLSASKAYGYLRHATSALHKCCSVEVPLRLAKECAYAPFLLQALLDWAARPNPAERVRYSEVQEAYRSLRIPFIWRFSVNAFLRHGILWPLRLQTFLVRVAVKLKGGRAHG